MPNNVAILGARCAFVGKLPPSQPGLEGSRFPAG